MLVYYSKYGIVVDHSTVHYIMIVPGGAAAAAAGQRPRPTAWLRRLKASMIHGTRGIITVIVYNMVPSII